DLRPSIAMVSKLVALQISGGSVPLKQLLTAAKDCNEGCLKIEPGIVPMNSLLLMSIFTIVLWDALTKILSKVPENWLPLTKNVDSDGKLQTGNRTPRNMLLPRSN